MIGKSQIQLGAEQLISGMASSDFATDGALGTTSVGLNPFIKPGTMYGMAAPVDVSTNLTGSLIASCEDAQSVGPLNRYAIDNASGAAGYYSFNGSTFTKQASGSATYVQGKADLISFDTQFFATTAGFLVKWNGTSTINETYQALQDGNAHHPLLVYQNLLWVGDGNTLSTLTSNGSGTGTYTTNVLVLGGGSQSATKEKIVALGIDPATGLMMISVESIYDVSDSIPSLKAVYLYDGISSKPTRKILVDDLITAFYNVEGNVYVGAGQTLGVWNGNGVTFLRKFQSVGLDNTQLAYKHHFTNIRNILCVIDGTNVLSYGAVVSEKKGFFYTAYNPTNANTLSIVMPVGSNRIVVSFASSKASMFDFSSTANVSTTNLYFNNIYFPRPIFVHRMRIITTGIAFTGTTNLTINITDEKNNSLGISTANRTITVPAGTTYVKDFDYGGAKCQGIQPLITPSNGNYGIVRVYIYYDPAE